jgi:hypothetical protein
VQQTLIGQPVQPVVHRALDDWQGAGAVAAQLARPPQVPVSIEALTASDLGDEAGTRVRTDKSRISDPYHADALSKVPPMGQDTTSSSSPKAEVSLENGGLEVYDRQQG